MGYVVGLIFITPAATRSLREIKDVADRLDAVIAEHVFGRAAHLDRGAGAHVAEERAGGGAVELPEDRGARRLDHWVHPRPA